LVGSGVSVGWGVFEGDEPDSLVGSGVLVGCGVLDADGPPDSGVPVGGGTSAGGSVGWGVLDGDGPAPPELSPLLPLPL
jgi:hypothetical protein